MDKLLTIKEVGELLQVNQRTILRMIQNEKIPALKIGNQWRFHPVHLEQWILQGGVTDNGNQNPSWITEEEFQLFSPHRVLLDIEAEDVDDVFKHMVHVLVECGHLLHSEIFLQALKEREQIATTGIGQGVALPHAWHTINDLFRTPLIVAARLDKAVDFNAVDEQPVDLVFMLCTPRNRTHLRLLSQLTSNLKDKDLLDALRKTKTKEEFIEIVTHQIPVVN